VFFIFLAATHVEQQQIDRIIAFPWQRFQYYILDSDVRTRTVQWERIAAYTCEQWLANGRSVKLYAVHAFRILFIVTNFDDKRENKSM
jgi:hypothetical protein